MHPTNPKYIFKLSIILFTVISLLIPLNEIYAQTIPARDPDNYYKYDILAAIGQNGLESLFGSPSINDNGATAFIGTSEGMINHSLFFSDKPGTIREVGRDYRFSWIPQINNSNQIVTRDIIYGSPTRTYIRRWNADSPGSSLIIAEGAESGTTAAAGFQLVWERPSINNNNQVAFSALANYPTYDPRLATGLDQPAAAIPMPGGFGANALRPMIADNGRLAILAGDPRDLAPIRLYNFDLTPVADIATPAMGFTDLGRTPGISDSGEIVAFLKENAAGRGIFASIDDGSGARRIIRVAGRPNELGTDDEDNPLSFSYFASGSRIPVAHQAIGADGIEDDIFIVAFKASVSNGAADEEKSGIWTVRVEMKRESGVLREIISPPQAVIQQGDVIAGYLINGSDDLGDAIAAGGETGEHFIAARVYTDAGTVIIRAQYKQLNPLIFIPGTMGSELQGPYFGGIVKYWVNVNRFATSDLPSVYNITLDQNSPYFTDGIYASDVLRKVLIAGVYQPLLDAFENMGYDKPYDVSKGYPDKSECDITQKRDNASQNPNLFVFPYDFRRDNGISAQKLAQYVQCVQRFYPAGTKVNIVGHSQGGLVARRYVLQKQLQNQPHGLDKVITIASPLLGAPEGTYKIYTGGKWDLPIVGGGFSAVISPPTIRWLSRHFPSVHQLFPSRTYHGWQGGFIFEGGDVNGNGIADENYSFEQITSQLNADFPETYPGTTGAGFHDFPGQDDWRGDQSGIQYYHLVAEQNQLNTTSALAVKDSWRCRLTGIGSEGGRCFENRLYIPAKGFGDGTVPTISASRSKNFEDGSHIYLGAPNSEWFITSSLSPDSSTENYADHNGITKYEKTHELLAYLLGVGPKPLDLEPAESFAASFSKSSGTKQSNTASINSASNEARFTRYSGSQIPAPRDLASYSPSYYLTIAGRTDVVIRDEEGNTAFIDDNELLQSSVGGLMNYEMIGDESIMLTLSTRHTYTIEFRAGAEPMGIELIEGRGNRNPISVLKYNDLDLPANLSARLTISQTEPSRLQTDADNDGGFETTVAPTVRAAGAAAGDVTPPTVSIGIVQNGNAASLSISAQDNESGVSKVWYSLDGLNFRLYTSTVALPYSSTPVRILAFADDNLANRSGSYAKTFAFTPIGEPTRAIEPILECVQANTDGSLTAHFGYESDNLAPVTIQIGGHNKFTPAPQDKGQPTTFMPGRQRNVFNVQLGSDSLIWSVKGADNIRRDVSASSSSTRCQ